MILLIIAVAAYGLITADHLLRKMMCLVIIESMVILGFIHTAVTDAATSPILTAGIKHVVNPVPQALMLTAIVISTCFNALALGLVVKLHRRIGTSRVSCLPND